MNLILKILYSLVVNFVCFSTGYLLARNALHDHFNKELLKIVESLHRKDD